MDESFWPKVIRPADIINPKDIIEDQAKILPTITEEKVVARVDMSKRSYYHNDLHSYVSYDFSYDFIITGTKLTSYKFRVFSFSFNIPIYPVDLEIDSEIAAEYGLDEKFPVGDESSLKDILKKIINSKKLYNIISSIMKLSE